MGWYQCSLPSIRSHERLLLTLASGFLCSVSRQTVDSEALPSCANVIAAHIMPRPEMQWD